MKIHWDWKHNWGLHISMLVMAIVEIAIVIWVLIPHNDGFAVACGVSSITIAIGAIFFYCKVITRRNIE